MKKTNRKKGIHSDDVVIFDVGCRYGIHPSWSSEINVEFNKLFCFEPDVVECDRLTQKYKTNKNISLYPMGLGETKKTVKLNLLKHRGLSSLLSPNKEATWFSDKDRSSAGEVEEVRKIKISKMDDVVKEMKLDKVDFLKV